MNSDVEDSLSGVWGSSATDVFAVGGSCDYFTRSCENSTILGLYDNSWVAMNSPAMTMLNDLWGTSRTNIYAVGGFAFDIECNQVGEGTVLKYDGSEWHPIISTSEVALFGIWGISSSDIFIVGEYCENITGNSGGIIYHFDGTALSEMKRIDYPLYDVWGSSGTDVFAVGVNGTILHYNGNEWLTMREVDRQYIVGIWGDSGDNVIAVGPYLLLHYDGKDWSHMSAAKKEYMGVWGISSTDVFIVGHHGSESAVSHYKGSEWSDAGHGTSGSLNSVWGSSSTDIFIVGNYGKIFRLTCPQ
jgi:hypothetical protein